jgi:hypothetical protein
MVLFVVVFSFFRLCFKYHPYSSYVFIHGDVIYIYMFLFIIYLWYSYFFICLAFVGCCISWCCVMLSVHEVNCSFKICTRIP